MEKKHTNQLRANEKTLTQTHNIITKEKVPAIGLYCFVLVIFV